MSYKIVHLTDDTNEIDTQINFIQENISIIKQLPGIMAPEAKQFEIDILEAITKNLNYLKQLQSVKN